MKNLFKTTFIIFILILSCGWYTEFSSSDVNLPDHIEYTPQINVAVVFINFDFNLLNTETISMNFNYSRLPMESLIPHNEINLDFIYPNQSYIDNVNNYIDTISSIDWTSKLNETAINIQRENFTKMSIFERQNGTAIDALKLENYLSLNRPKTSLVNDNLYYLYFMNLSRLDIGGYKHWLNITEVDPDSGVARFYWRLEWDYGLNFGVKFPYAAFSQNTDIGIIDLTSFQWYLNWVKYWNDISYPTSTNTLTELIKGKYISEQQLIVTNSISIWLNAWVNSLIDMLTVGETLGEEVNSKIIIFYRKNEVSLDKIRWIINNEYARSEIGYITQSTNITIDTRFIALEDDNLMNNFLNTNKLSYEAIQGIPSPFGGEWSYYNGYNIWDTIYGNNSISFKYFNNQNFTVKGFIFILENSSFVFNYPGGNSWPGGLFTGLGGEGVINILYELHRAFMPNLIDHRAGLSKILIHEMGHAIGFPHTFYLGYPADFISDVMGYYPGTANFSQITTDAYWRQILDFKIENFTEIYTQQYSFIQNLQQSEFNHIMDNYNHVINLRMNKEYLQAYNLIIETIQYLKNLSQKPFTSSIDGFLPFYSNFTTLSIIALVIINRKFRLKKSNFN